MSIRKSYMIGVLTLLVVVITACHRGTEGVSPLFVSPISTSLSPIVAAPTIEVSLPEAGKGNVHGSLSLANFPLPLESAELYLGNVFTSDDNQFSTYYFNKDQNPRAQWLNAETGEFLFEDVEPGEYVLILWWDIQSYIPIYRAGTTQAITVTVTSDSITELGTIVSNQ